MLEFDYEDSPACWICTTAHSIERAMNEELAPHGITYPQWRVLGWLGMEGELTQSQLAERMHIEAPTLVGILERMERDGWITRQTPAEDRRKRLVRPTPRVEPVWAKIVDAARKIRARYATGIEPADLQVLKRVLAKLRENLARSKQENR